jgi:ferric-dicitrate binding protein FerR (iron transport regulator)
MLRSTQLALVLAALALVSPPTRSLAQSPSGEAEKVSQAAQAQGAIGARVLDVAGPVYMGDEISTNRSGEAQIRFVDDTRFVVGPNARVFVDKFVFAGSTARSVTFSAVKGAFRFITGDSPKSAYLIRTPVMTIGVRGTGLDGFVETGTGRTTVAVYEGTAELCDAANQCILAEAGCTIVVVPPGGGFQDPTPATRGLFLPYSVSQASLLPPYRLDTSGCSGAAAPLRTPPESSDSTGGRGSSGSRNDPDGGGENYN